MVSQNEFHELMKAAAQVPVSQISGHIGEAQMIAFCEDRLPATERERIQKHLMSCSECLRLFRETSDFFAPLREGEEQLTKAEIAEGWSSIWSRIEIDSRNNILPFSRRYRPSRAMLALAATLLLSFGGIGALTWGLIQARQEKQRAMSALGESQTRNHQLEEQIALIRSGEQSSQQQATNERQKRLELEEQILAMRNPGGDQQSFPQNISPNYLTLTTQKSSADENTVYLPPRAEAVLLILTINNPLDFPAYSVELSDKEGRQVQQVSGLTPSGGENTLNVTLNRAGLKSGKYDLALYGWKDGKRQSLGKFELTIKNSG